MNGTSVNATQNQPIRSAKLPPSPAPPAPATAPPATPVQATSSMNQQAPANRTNPPPHQHHHPPTVNGHHLQSTKGKKRNDAPVDPATMYESLKNRIAALEEEEVIEEEEERRFGACRFPPSAYTFLDDCDHSGGSPEVCQGHGGKHNSFQVH